MLVCEDDDALRVSGFIENAEMVGQARAERLTDLGENVIDLNQVEDPGTNNRSFITEFIVVTRRYPEIKSHTGQLKKLFCHFKQE